MSISKHPQTATTHILHPVIREKKDSELKVLRDRMTSGSNPISVIPNGSARLLEEIEACPSGQLLKAAL